MENYVGLINYLTGDIYIKQSDWILQNIPQRRRRRGGKYLHGRLFYFIFKYWKMQNTTFIGRGFSYLNGEWKFLSRTLNTNTNGHRLNQFEQKLLQVVIDNLYINHQWIEMPPDYRIDCQGLAALERNKKYISRVHPSNVHANRKLHGTVKLLNNQRSRLGFIQCIGLDRDIYIHSTAILNSLSCSGKNIEFNVVQECHGWKAENISAVWP
jgi:cold shock CspA family protein